MITLHRVKLEGNKGSLSSVLTDVAATKPFDARVRIFGPVTSLSAIQASSDLYTFLKTNTKNIVLFFEDAAWLNWITAWILAYTEQPITRNEPLKRHIGYAGEFQADIIETYVTQAFEITEEAILTMSELDAKLRSVWFADPDKRRVLLFSLLWSRNDEYINSHCSSPGNVKLDSIRNTLANFDELLVIDEESGTPQYELRAEYIPFARIIVDEIFGQTLDQLRDWLIDRFDNNNGWVNSAFRDTVLRFFRSPFVPSVYVKCSREERNELYHSSTYFIEYQRDAVRWNALLVFVPYCFGCEQESYFAEHVGARAGEFGVATNNPADMRFLISPFLPGGTLQPVESKNRQTSRIHCLDAVAAAYMDKCIRDGNLSADEADRMSSFTEKHLSGLFNIRQRWLTKVKRQ